MATILFKNMYKYRLKERCAVRGCPVTGRNTETKLFRFPKNPERYSIWVQFSQDLSLQTRQRSVYMCGCHFEPHQFQDKLCQVLRCGAVPSLRPGQASPGPVLATTATSTEVSHVNSDNVDVYPSCSTTSITNTRPSCAVRLFQSQQSSDAASDVLATPLDFSICEDVLSGVAAASTPLNTSQSKRRSAVLAEIQVSRQKELTPRKKSLFGRLRKLRRNYLSLKRKFHNQTLTLKELDSRLKSTDLRILEFLSKSMSATSAKFLAAQVRNVKHLPKGRRWTEEDKLQALILYRRSPKGYNALRALFPFPSKTTLRTLLYRIPFFPGINNHMFNVLHQSVSHFEELDCTCSLMFDEMSIREHVDYSSKLDRIMGYEDKGTAGVSNAVANHALVFVVQGLHKKWIQPVAFYLSRGAVKAEDLVEILKEVLEACTKAGLHVVNTVCDMGTNNVKAVKALGSSFENPVFSYRGQEVVTLFDPPHLLKCTRNRLLESDALLYEENGGRPVPLKASWRDIQDAFMLDEPCPFRLLHTITRQHIEPKGASKMKVKLAAQVFSQKMAGAIYSLVANGKTPRPSAVGTSALCSLMNKLFDSCNGRSKEATGPGNLRCRVDVSREDLHLQFWNQALAKVDSLLFLKRSADRGESYDSSSLYHKVFRPPSQDGWIATLNGMQILWHKLKEKGFTFLETRALNQDPIEHMFGCIRSCCGSNDNPTVVQFLAALKTAIVNGLAFRDLKGLNCELEENPGEVLNNLHSFVFAEPETAADQYPSTALQQDPPNPSLMAEVAESFSNAKVSGYIASRLLRGNLCSKCRIALTTDMMENRHLGIYFQEYDKGATVMTYPSEDLCRTVALGSTLVEEMLSTSSHLPGVRHHATEVICGNVSFDWIGNVCVDHALSMKEGILSLLTQLCVHWWCKRHNRMLGAKAHHRSTARRLRVFQHH